MSPFPPQKRESKKNIYSISYIHTERLEVAQAVTGIMIFKHHPIDP